MTTLVYYIFTRSSAADEYFLNAMLTVL